MARRGFGVCGGGVGGLLLFEYAVLQHGLVCFALSLLAGSD